MIEACQKAKVEIMKIYNQGFDVEIKDDDSPVTLADKTADKIQFRHFWQIVGTMHPYYHQHRYSFCNIY